MTVHYEVGGSFDEAAGSTRHAHRRDSAYAWYVVVVLAMLQAVSFIDRQLINLLVGPIKEHFTLNDTSMSLLIGVALTSVYVLIALPAGRWIDSGNRRNILLGCGVIWCFSTMWAGVADSYTELFFSRVGVGAAESAVYPGAVSLIAAYFSRENLPRAMSIMLSGTFIGGGLALIFGGLIVGALSEVGSITLPLVGTLLPWQMTFLIVGAGGLVPIVLLLTVAEPPRTQSVLKSSDEHAKFTTAQGFAYVWKRARFYVLFIAGVSLHVVAIYAVPAWGPSLLIRKFAAPISQVGIQFGCAALAGGALGMLAGPSLNRYFKARGHEDAVMRTVVLGTGLTIPVAIALPMMPTYWLTLATLCAITFVYTLPLSLCSAALQEVAPEGLRGFVGALYFASLSIIGLGIAPTLVGVMTDFVFADPKMVGWSLSVVVGIAGTVGCTLLALSMKGYRAGLRERFASAAGN